MEKTRIKTAFWSLMMLPVYLAVAVALVMVVARSGICPAGVDTLCHIYKGDILYQSILKGDWWPTFDALWYNGVEMLRYWAPLPVYVFAGCQALAGGDPINGYLVFVGLLYYLYAVVWLYVGGKLDRPFLGSFLGTVWFLLPNNLVALFEEGNLPRTICVGVMPLLFLYIHQYAEGGDWRALPKLSAVFMVIALCHAGYAGMILIALGIMALIYRLAVRKKGRILPLLAALLLGYLLTGWWLLPSLIGGLTSTDSSEIMAAFFQPLEATLNPLHRLSGMGLYDFYFGLSAFLIALLGAFFGPRKAVPGFLSGVVVVLLTSTAAYPVLAKLPGGQYLWMLRFLSIALCMVLFSLLLWKELKRGLLVLLCLLLVADTVPSLPLFVGSQSGQTAYEIMDGYSDWTLTREAKALTTQRLALVDESALDAMSPYLVTGYEDRVATTYGAAWQSCTISTNFKQVDRSLEMGCYYYLFDRCKELGNDTVLIRLAVVKDLRTAPVEYMDLAAQASGYTLKDANGLYRLYHLDGAPRSWGTVTTYSAIGIGTYAAASSLAFPAMEETASNNLSDYTYEELSRYELVLLAGFTYDDRSYAEDLILRLTENGTRVVIVADGIPEDRSTRDQSFLGVLCNPIVFQNGYPELETTRLGRINADLFPAGHTTWKTVFVNGLDEVWGYLYDAGLEVDFMGTKHNDNLVFVGLNLFYFQQLTMDATVGRLLSYALELHGEQLPERRVVPLEVEYDGDFITVTSPEDNVNSTLAIHDSFVTDRAIESRNHLTYVQQGTTHFEVAYPYLLPGMGVSVAAVVGLVILTVLERRRCLWEQAGDERAGGKRFVPGQKHEEQTDRGEVDLSQVVLDVVDSSGHKLADLVISQDRQEENDAKSPETRDGEGSPAGQEGEGKETPPCDTES